MSALLLFTLVVKHLAEVGRLNCRNYPSFRMGEQLELCGCFRLFLYRSRVLSWPFLRSRRAGTTKLLHRAVRISDLTAMKKGLQALRLTLGSRRFRSGRLAHQRGEHPPVAELKPAVVQHQRGTRWSVAWGHFEPGPSAQAPFRGRIGQEAHEIQPLGVKFSRRGTEPTGVSSPPRRPTARRANIGSDD